MFVGVDNSDADGMGAAGYPVELQPILISDTLRHLCLA
jgi:hypothetical protein